MKFEKKSRPVLSKRAYLPFGLLSITGLLFSIHAQADTCITQTGAEFECIDKNTIQVSDTTAPFFGTKPELGIQLSLVTKEKDTETPIVYELVDGYKLPKGVEITEGSIIKVNYFLVNGLTEALVETGIQPLAKGKFDADGDPIDSQKIYDYITWYSGDQSNVMSKILKLNHPYDEVTITSDICVNGTVLTVGATPYTYTGDPKEGDTLYTTLSDESGVPYVFTQCTDKIDQNDVLVVIKKNEGTENEQVFVDQTNRTENIDQDAQVGDELTATLYVKQVDEKGVADYIDVTARYENTIVWGYKIRAEDKVNSPDGKAAGMEQVIWMDGTQTVGPEVVEVDKNTTGKRTFKVQTTNLNARAQQSVNLSEQAMRVIFKFGETQ